MAGSHELGTLLADLALIYLAAKIGGELFLRLKQPAVLGELVAGLIVGVSGLQWIDPQQPILHLMAQIGVTLLLFEIGLESDIKALFRVGKQALAVGLIGMVAPFALGYGIMTAMGAAPLLSVFVGATMTATSIGITAKVLSDLKRLNSTEGKIILGAAILDDILGIVILSVIAGVTSGTSFSWPSVALIFVKSLAFLTVALVVGNLARPYFMRLIQQLRSRGVLLTASLIFAFALAVIAEKLGSAAIIGAFAAGLVLAKSDQRHDLEKHLRPVTDFFLPIFFVTVGAGVELGLFADPATVMLALLLTAAIIGKLAAGMLGTIGAKSSGWIIGAGMVPRGEVGLIFASLGLGTGVLSGANHAAVVAMVMLTTFIGPLMLNFLIARQKNKP
jgi:Kef-type K+ transport system membrane component KefB